MEQHQKVETAREVARRKRKHWDGNKQQFLVGNENNYLSVFRKPDPKLQARWDDSVVNYVAETGVSFQACEKLVTPLRAIWPNGLRLKVRHATTVSRHVHERSLSLKIELYSLLHMLKDSIGGLAFTTDMWRSRALDSYLALTAHVMTEDMELFKMVPFVQYFGPNRHTGENIHLMMDQMLKAIGMDSDNISKTCVSDNASNNKVMFDLSNNLQSYYCCLHTMQLCVIGIFEMEVLSLKVGDVMDKCKELAKYVRRSEKNRDALRDACTITETNFILIILPNDTRWHSKEANLSSVLKLSRALRHLAENDDSAEWTDKVPTLAEFKLLRSLQEILERIKICCKIWESDTRPTIQTVITELFDIRDILQRKVNARERYVSVFAKELLRLIERRFPKCGTTVPLNIISHLLDPAWQGCLLKQFPGTYQTAKDEVLRIGSKYESERVEREREESPPPQIRAGSDENENMSASQRLRIQELADSGENNRGAERIPVSTERELQSFLAMKIPTDTNTNVQLFWKAHKVMFPTLFRVAREVFCVPASSASSERVFSIGSLVSFWIFFKINLLNFVLDLLSQEKQP